MKVNLGNYTWEEVKDLSDKDPVVLLPLGAFEQHGKHLPLKVDEFMVNNIDYWNFINNFRFNNQIYVFKIY